MRIRHVLIAVFLLGLLGPVRAQVPVTLFQAFAGDVNYVTTGATLRTAPNSGPGANPCAVGPAGTGALTGIPGGSTIRAAYLYWAGSYLPGTTPPDYNITFNGINYAASRTFTEVFNFGGTNYDFFSGFADVTAQVTATGNANYTLTNLAVHTGGPHCGSSAVLAGWAVVVVYDNPVTERLRVLNVFDGFQFFRGSSLNLTLANFRASAAPDGRMTVVTWEGDTENSAALNGFSESLTFNGNVLSDAMNPANNQFNSTINTIPSNTTYGVDVDTYVVDPFISPGDTSATSVYSSGGDLVLLSAQVAAFSSDPLADMSISKTHTGNFVAGNNHDYTIRVTNNGPVEDPATITVTDTLPAGLSFVSGSGGSWVCNAVGQDVTCTHAGPLLVGASHPDLVLTVAVDENAIPSVDNTATVSTGSYDANPANDSVTDTTVVVGPDLSTSTKSVVDLNGGDAEPGDTLRYTVTLIESAGHAVTGVQVTDDIPALVENFTVISTPAGSTDNSTGAGTGANGAGLLDIRNISVPANGSVTVVFDVDVLGSASAGDVISNTANVRNPSGPDATAVAPDVVVRASQVPASGLKSLYLFDSASGDPNGFNQGPQPYLSRTPPAGPQGNVVVDKPNPPVTWTMTPALQAPLTVVAGTVPVTLWVSKGGGSGNAVQRQINVTLDSIGATTGAIGTPVTISFAAPPSGAPLQLIVNVPVAVDTPLAAGSQVRLTVQNTTSGGGNRRIRVFPIGTTDNSRIDMDVTPVINVDSVTSFDAAYPGGSPAGVFGPGQTVYVRAVVSDPFGSFDITLATVDLDASGVPQVTGAAMTEVADSGVDTKTYEFAYTIPNGAPTGNWTARVTAVEGTEGVVTDTGSGSFVVAVPDLTVLKSSQVLSDPYSSSNPKAIPGAVVSYTITVTNQGGGATDPDSVVISDALPPESALFVDTGSGDPIVFIDGAVPSGLTYNYATDVSFSNQPGGGSPYSYVPVADAEGFDAAVTGIRISPSGAINGAGAGTPSFSLRLLIRVE